MRKMFFRRRMFYWVFSLLLVIVGFTFQKAGHSIAAEQVTITYWKFGFGLQQVDAFKNWGKEYEKLHPNVKFIYQEFPWNEYFEKMTISLAAGKGPDIFWSSSGDFLKYEEQGVLFPLNDYIPEDLKRDMDKQSLEAVTRKGKILALPWSGLDVVTLFYNKELFAQAGLQPPKTWDELIQAAQKLTTPERWGLFINPTPGIAQNFYWYPFLWQAGGEVVDKDMKKSLFYSPATIQALRLWSDLMNKYKAIPKSAMPDPLPTGKAAMEIRGPFMLTTIQRKYSDFMENVGITALPYPANGKKITIYGGFNSVVNAKSKHPEEAAKFHTWLFKDQERRAIWLTKLATSMDSRQSVRNHPIFVDYWGKYPQKTIVENLPFARPEPVYPPEIVESVSKAIQGVLQGGISPEEAAKKAHEEIQVYLDKKNR